MAVNLTADGVRMNLEHNRKGQPIMVLSDADHGNFRFDASFDDLNKIILTMARQQASPMAWR